MLCWPPWPIPAWSIPAWSMNSQCCYTSPWHAWQPPTGLKYRIPGPWPCAWPLAPARAQHLAPGPAPGPWPPHAPPGARPAHRARQPRPAVFNHSQGEPSTHPASPNFNQPHTKPNLNLNPNPCSPLTLCTHCSTPCSTPCRSTPSTPCRRVQADGRTKTEAWRAVCQAL